MIKFLESVTNVVREIGQLDTCQRHVIVCIVAIVCITKLALTVLAER